MVDIQTTEDENKLKRPAGVWIISIFYFISAILVLISISMINKVPGDVMARFSGLHIAVSMASGVLNFIAAYYLFLLKARAFWLFLASMLLGLVFVVFTAIFGDLSSAGVSAGSQAFQMIIWVVMMSYIWRLKKIKTLT